MARGEANSSVCNGPVMEKGGEVGVTFAFFADFLTRHFIRQSACIPNLIRGFNDGGSSKSDGWFAAKKRGEAGII